MPDRFFLALALLARFVVSSAIESSHTFTLRHVHETHAGSGRIRWADVSDDLIASSPLTETSNDGSATHTHVLHSRPINIVRPISQPAFHAHRHRSRKRRRGAPLVLQEEFGQNLEWEKHEVEGPATEKRETLLALAKMTNNAYFSEGKSGWYELGANWTNDHNVGWDPDVTGFRGHVFLSSDNKAAILSIKGTSAVVFGGSATVFKDKLNDNLLFSCCCARVDWTWNTVCDCFRGRNKCDQSCVEDSLTDESLFYHVGINLYNNLTFMYPDAKIWITGHSLGGSLASLIGATFGAPVVAFEAVGEKMAAQRLHLPIPPSVTHITHVYNTADPIPMGVCTGRLSACYAGGYALESKCHLGTAIVYDTVGALHWSVNIRAHFVTTIVDQLLDEDWSKKVNKAKKYWRPSPFPLPFPWWGSEGHKDEDEEVVEVPSPTPEINCADCFRWEFGDFPAAK